MNNYMNYFSSFNKSTVLVLISLLTFSALNVVGADTILRKISDNFDRTDLARGPMLATWADETTIPNPIGEEWCIRRGEWRISANQLTSRSKTEKDEDILLVNNAAGIGSKFYIAADVKVSSYANTWAGIAFCIQPNQHSFYTMRINGTGVLQMIKVVKGGTGSNSGIIGISDSKISTLQGNIFYRICISSLKKNCNFHYKVSTMDGAILSEADVVDSNNTFIEGGVGLYASGSLGVFDNFSCGEEDPGPVAELLYNGIELPTEWPPKTENYNSVEPMEVPYLSNPPKVIKINIGRQLFVDDFLVEKTDLARVFHSADKFEGNPVFKAETKWELDPTPVSEGLSEFEAVCFLGHGGVFFDPKEKIFKMFYSAGMRGGLAYATSKDLKTWIRPNLNIVDQNILLPPGVNFAGHDNSIWLDLNAEDPNERLKLITFRGAKNWHHTLHVSNDGRVWSQGIVTTGMHSDYCSIFYNPFRNVWVFSIKPSTALRARSYYESKDFLTGFKWQNAVFWAKADKLDEPDPVIGDKPQLYSLNAVAYESIMLGEFYIHLGPSNEVCAAKRIPKKTIIKLGFSRDGFYWSRPDRHPFINAAQRDSDWDKGYVHGTTGICAVIGDKIWFPYCAASGISPTGKKAMYSGVSIGLATLRRDGFASMEAGTRQGVLITRPVTFNGQHFFVNVDCPKGLLRVEILDENNKILNPFSARKCCPLKVDKTLQSVQWKGTSDLLSLKGKIVKFKFYLTNGKLYSFWVSPDKTGASFGYVGAGGPGFNGVVDTKGIQSY